MRTMIVILLIGFIAFAVIDKPEAQAEPKNETVVLLHGLCRTSRSMAKMETALEAEGYNVINVDYPSRSATIDELTKQVFQSLEKQVGKPAPHVRQTFQPAKPIHFVTHSMGGILLGRYLELEGQRPRCPDAGDGVPPQKGSIYDRLGNVVMLAPPSRGSEVPDKLGGLKLYQWINGPAGNQLGTNSHPLRLDVPGSDIGVIAGDRSINPILSLLIPGPDDGKVSLARVKPAAYTDYLQLHVTHACMMRNPRVIKQTKYFLEHGTFESKEIL